MILVNAAATRMAQHRGMKISKIWLEKARDTLLAERDAASPTPLRELRLPALPGKRLVFKDESVHPSGSLKHRLARSLLLQGLDAGRIGRGTPLFDASSGNTAVSEAWFAARLGLPFFAVIPETTSIGKQQLIERFGGTCVRIAPGRCCKREAARLAIERGGYFLDQFTNAAIATDWRAHNVVSEMFAQLSENDVPDWFVAGAGTGGTATTAGRFFRYRNLATKLMVVDPEDSAFFNHYACVAGASGCLCASRVEGIGRPAVEPSFRRGLVDRMQRVADAASFGAALWLSVKLGKKVGVSTGTNLVGAISLLDEPDTDFVATLVCDGGERYAGRLDNDEWLAEQGMDIEPWIAALDRWFRGGEWQPPVQPVDTRVRTSA